MNNVISLKDFMAQDKTEAFSDAMITGDPTALYNLLIEATQQIRNCTLFYIPDDAKQQLVNWYEQEVIIGKKSHEFSTHYYGEGHAEEVYGFNQEFHICQHLVKTGFLKRVYHDKHWRKLGMNKFDWHREAFGELFYIEVKYIITPKGYKLVEAIKELKPTP